MKLTVEETSCCDHPDPRRASFLSVSVPEGLRLQGRLHHEHGAPARTEGAAPSGITLVSAKRRLKLGR